MLNIQTLRTPTGEPTTSKPPLSQAPGASGDPAGFASLLRQTRTALGPAPAPSMQAPVAAPQPAPVPAPHAEPSSGVKVESSTRNPSQAAAQTQPRNTAVGTGAPPLADPASRRQALLMTKPRAADTDDAPQRGLKPAADGALPGGGTAPDPAADKTADLSEDAAPTTLFGGGAWVDPVPVQWLAGLQRTAAAALASAEASGATRPGEAATGSTDTARSSATDLQADADSKDDTLPGTAPGEGQLLATLAGPSGAEKPLPREAAATPGFKGIAGLATAAAAWTPPVASGSVAGSPVAVTLATPVSAPEFAHAFGVQMSVLASNGIQHAELQLNPPDMGPVSVRILMDGTQARVDFGADVAATRQAIEAGMPALAGALRDAGFTLAGGGVSQHSRSRDDGADASPNRRARRTGADAADESLGATRRAVRTTLSLGGLDLYA